MADSHGIDSMQIELEQPPFFFLPLVSAGLPVRAVIKSCLALDVCRKCSL